MQLSSMQAPANGGLRGGRTPQPAIRSSAAIHRPTRSVAPVVRLQASDGEVRGGGGGGEMRCVLRLCFRLFALQRASHASDNPIMHQNDDT